MTVDATLAASALLMGLAGSPHCAAMCGAAYAGLAPHGVASRPGWALHAGRVAGYAAAGALVAASAAWFTRRGVATPVLRPLWWMLHVAAVALGVWLMWAGRAPAWLAGATRHGSRMLQAQPVRFVARLPPAARSAAIGGCWAAMPCGLLQSALIVAALASGPWQGAGVMSAFALASGVGLWLGPALWRRLRRADSAFARGAWPVRFAGALLVAASGFALTRALAAAIDPALCAPAA